MRIKLGKIRYFLGQSRYHLKIFLSWLHKHRHGVTLKEILNSYSLQLYKKKVELNNIIERIEEQPNSYKVYIRNFSIPLFHSKKIPFQDLEIVILELLGSLDWHRYEKMGTFIRPNDIVIDCGAAEGLFTLMVKDRCKHVYAVEISPTYIKVLKETFLETSSPSKNITIIDKGLSSQTDNLYVHEYHLSSYFDNNPENGTPVSVDTIDNLFYHKNIPVNFIKADLEGFERQMLKGAINTIKHNKPRIAITTYHTKGDFEFIKNFLKELDPEYIIEKKGIGMFLNGEPTMLHAYVPGY